MLAVLGDSLTDADFVILVHVGFARGVVAYDGWGSRFLPIS